MSTLPHAAAPRARDERDVRLLAWIVGAGALWIALYLVNGPFWEWLLFDVIGLDPASRPGESICSRADSRARGTR